MLEAYITVILLALQPPTQPATMPTTQESIQSVSANEINIIDNLQTARANLSKAEEVCLAKLAQSEGYQQEQHNLDVLEHNRSLARASGTPQEKIDAGAAWVESL